MTPSNSSTSRPVYGHAWAVKILTAWYEKHPDSKKLVAMAWPEFQDSVLIEWIRTPTDQVHWENYKRAIKYLEYTKPKYDAYFKGNEALYVRLVQRVINPIFFEKFEPGLLDEGFNPANN